MVFVGPIGYQPIPGIFLILLGPVSDFYSKSQTFSESSSRQLPKFGRKYEHKDKDSYKDKDKDARGITETITVCYTFEILTTQAFQI